MEKQIQFLDPNLATVEYYVATRDLADILGVGVSTVKDTVKKLSRVLGSVKKNNQGGFLFNEEQATLIKQEIQKHHNLKSRQIDNVSTELEENETIANAIMILQRRNIELQKRAEIAETTLNKISDGKGCFTINQTAKALKLNYGNITLFKKLKQMNLLNSDNTPRQDQINSGHFKVIVKEINEQIGNKPVTLVTSSGLVYLAKKFNTTIDESILPDA